MKKFFTYMMFMVIGGFLGYYINEFYKPKNQVRRTPENVYVETIKTQIIKDTIEIEKIIEIPIETKPEIASENMSHFDTLAQDLDSSVFIDSVQNINYEEVIITEELIAQRIISPLKIEKDTSDVSELLNLKTMSFADDIMVEFWQSPLNITGYELTRNKLKLFGFNPNESISLQLNNEDDQILLNTESMSLTLYKTDQFKTLKLK